MAQLLAQATPGPWRYGEHADRADLDWAVLLDVGLQPVASTKANVELEALAPELAAWALEAAAALKKADPFLFNSPLEGSLDVWQIVNKAGESFDRIGEP